MKIPHCWKSHGTAQITFKLLSNCLDPFRSPPQFRELDHGLGVCKEHYAQYYVPKSSILFAGNGAVKISSEACGFSPFKIYYSDYPKSFISRINEVYFFP